MKTETPPPVRDLLHRVDALTPPTPARPPYRVPEVSRAPTTSSDRRLVPVVAAVVLVVTGIAAIAQFGSDQSQVPGSATAPPRMTVPPADELAATDACVLRLDERRTSGLAGPLQDLFPDAVDEVVVLHEDDSEDLWVLLLDDEAGFACEFAPGPGLVVRGDPFPRDVTTAPPGPNQITIEARNLYSYSTDNEPGVGAFRYIGRSGSNVTGVSVSFDDHTIKSGPVNRGWFIIVGAVPRGASTDNELVTWTLADGRTRSAEAEQLDGSPLNRSDRSSGG